MWAIRRELWVNSVPARAALYSAVTAAGYQAAQAQSQQPAAPAAPGPKSVRERLADLKSLLDDGLISEDDFNQRKAQILADV